MALSREIVLESVQVVLAEVWQSESMITLGIMALGVALVFLLKPVLVRWLRECLIKRTIRKFGDRAIHKVVLPDGMDGEVFVENLVLTAEAIVIVSVKRYDGLIYGGVNTDMWTQVLKGRNYPFLNPFTELNIAISALRQLLPQTKVESIVVFAGGGTFPKGKPKGVMTLSDLRGMRYTKRAPERLLADWEVIKRLKKNENSAGKSVATDQAASD